MIKFKKHHHNCVGCNSEYFSSKCSVLDDYFCPYCRRVELNIPSHWYSGSIMNLVWKLNFYGPEYWM